MAGKWRKKGRGETPREGESREGREGGGGGGGGGGDRREGERGGRGENGSCDIISTYQQVVYTHICLPTDD